MCGIAGIWGRSGAPVARASLERMAAILEHRGPEGSGIHLDGDLGLANRRLAILDPTPAGAQPMALEDRGLWLTYNGEIHNYVELRRELESLGARFRTHSPHPSAPGCGRRARGARCASSCSTRAASGAESSTPAGSNAR